MLAGKHVSLSPSPASGNGTSGEPGANANLATHDGLSLSSSSGKHVPLRAETYLARRARVNERPPQVLDTASARDLYPEAG